MKQRHRFSKTLVLIAATAGFAFTGCTTTSVLKNLTPGFDADTAAAKPSQGEIPVAAQPSSENEYARFTAPQVKPVSYSSYSGSRKHSCSSYG